jgi:hypothetical protein
MTDWTVDYDGNAIELNEMSAPPGPRPSTSTPPPVPRHFGDCKADSEWPELRQWNREVLEQLRANPPIRHDDDWYRRNQRQHSAFFTHAQLRNQNFRQKILRLYPGTRFRYSEMTDDNIYDYWYVGIPQKIWPKFWFHLTRHHAANYFDRAGSFVAQLKIRYGRDVFQNCPPPLLILLADQIRRSEYIRLKGEALIGVQRKFSVFETFVHLEPAEILANQIFDETLPEFLERMGPEFIRFKFSYGLL